MRLSITVTATSSRGQDGDKACSRGKRILDSMVLVQPSAPFTRILATQTSSKTKELIHVRFPTKHVTNIQQLLPGFGDKCLISGKHSHNRTRDCPDNLPHEEGRVASCRSLVLKGTLGNICSTEDRVDQRGGIILPEILGHQVMTIGYPTFMYKSARRNRDLI